MWHYEGAMEGEVAAVAVSSMGANKVSLTIDGEEETAERRIERLISENPVVIFSRSSCYMCHVMKKLLSAIGVHPTVIELEEGEVDALAVLDEGISDGGGGGVAPAVFIGGASIGGLDRLIALHLSGNLIPKLREVGALWA
ncbi:hypothetical protein Syun_011783 [Stephania yunnanensis]|uniref:Glutaredoxin domain-containing protein n=1 Tax=Stephania yunnanensis TaxID=152371 RepID=A0AAP0JZF1_9MAGN